MGKTYLKKQTTITENANSSWIKKVETLLGIKIDVYFQVSDSLVNQLHDRFPDNSHVTKITYFPLEAICNWPNETKST